MFAIGLQCAGSAFLAAGFKVQLAIALTVLGLVIFLCAHPRDRDDAPVTLSGFSLLNILHFFFRRLDFLNDGFRTTGQPIFQFNLLTNTVIVVSGETGRNIFFGTKGFDLSEGFRVLSGAIPMVKGVTSRLNLQKISMIHRQLAALQKNVSLTRLIPPILGDCQRIMNSYGNEGLSNPFEMVHELTFQITIRSLSCSEIADDSALVTRLRILYDKLDSAITPATALAPWFPGPGMISKLSATKEIYDTLVRAIDTRERSGIAKDDTLQMLLDAGGDKNLAVGFIMGLFTAGARATGTTASWLITFLGCYIDWQAKARLEIQDLLSSYPLPTDTPYFLSTHLSTIPISVWESQTPILDGVIRETLRLAQPHVAMRRNVGPAVYIGDRMVPTGAYLVYPFSDVHLDPRLYKDPWVFNPARGGPNNEGKEAEDKLEFVGWGAGRSVCGGQRLAKIELKLMASMFLLGFDFSVVDQSGNPQTSSSAIPRPNWNDTLLYRPERPCYLKYSRRGCVAL